MNRPRGTDGVSDFMGFEHLAPGRIRVAVRPELINMGGLLSGAVPFALIDYAMGTALWVETTKEESIATINIAINYVATAIEGSIVCAAELDRRTRSSAVLRAEVKTEGDEPRLLATAIGSYSIFPRRRPTPAAP
jgi:uncharacterized protein (TIGR00369 family)